jgi:hypothetical protein
LIAEVDVFDFLAGSWSRLGPSSDLPSPRAASAVAVFGGEILVIGGEGDGQAYDRVDGFDPVSGGWSVRAPLNHRRHGTQAIVSGQGVYVTAGSPSQGGGNQRNMEVYDTDAPGGLAGVAGVLSAPPTATVASANPATIFLSHVAGNQGAFVNDVRLTGADAADFGLLTAVADPFLVKTSGARALVVEYTGTSEGAVASLEVTHGGGELLSVALTGTLAAGPPGAAASLMVGKSGEALDLSWSADCGAGDVFGIYRGDLALGYGSLAADGCDVAGTATTISAGLPDGEFFLVVPSLFDAEGSYGQDSSCTERLPASTSCHVGAPADPCANRCAGP